MTERWRALWVLSTARVAMGFQFQAIGSTGPLLREQFGLSLADIGWLVGIYLLPGVVLALPGGLLSARFGDRRIAMAGRDVARPRLSVLSPREWGLLGLAGGAWMFYNVAFAVLVSFVPTGVPTVPTLSRMRLTWTPCRCLSIRACAKRWPTSSSSRM